MEVIDWLNTVFTTWWSKLLGRIWILWSGRDWRIFQKSFCDATLVQGDLQQRAFKAMSDVFNSVSQLSVGGCSCPLTWSRAGGKKKKCAHSCVHSEDAIGFSPLPWMLQSLPVDQQGMLTFQWSGKRQKEEKNAPRYLQVMSCGHDAKASMD